MTDRDRRRAWIAGFVIVSVVAAAGLGWLVGRATRSSSAAAAVTLLPADAVGADPFTESVAVAQAPDVRTIGSDLGASLTTDSRTRTLVAVGTAPGLYGGSGNSRVCDAQKLVSFLAQHRDKATAWARVFGITPDDIASYVASLTPVVLTGDTLVTNHGYHDGVATAFPSVLQAGTAVFVDRTGVPRVKCNCGNPLAPPAAISLSSVTLQGARWPGYAPTQVRVVRAGPAASTLTLVNVTTGARYDEAVGSGRAGQWVGIALTNAPGTASQTTIYTSATGATWGQVGTITNEMIRALVWVDDHWVALARRDEEVSTRILTSTDLRSWKQIGQAADALGAIAHGDGRFVATGAHWTSPLLEGGTPHSSPVAYTSTDGKRWTKVGGNAFTSATSQNGWSPPLAYGDRRWISLGQGDFVAGGLEGTVLTSDDGVHWSENGGHPTIDGNASLAFGAGTWALAGFEPGGLAWSTDAKTWTAASVSAVSTPDAETIAFGNGTFLAANLSVGATTMLSSSDGRSWAPVGTGPLGVDVLAFGGRAAGAASPPAEATGTPACTREALQDVFSHDIEDDMDVAILRSTDQLQCADGWAAIHYGNQGRYPLAVFHVVNGVWTTLEVNGAENLGEGERQTAGQFCTDPAFPAVLKDAVCG